MQNGRPLSPRAQAASAHNETGSSRNEPGRSFANVENSSNNQSTNGNTRNQGWQTNNINDPMCTINLPQISRSARPDTTSVITIQPHPSRRQRTLQSEENNTVTRNENSLPRHPRLTSDIPPMVPPRPENTLTSKSRLTTMSTARINPSQHRLSSPSQSLGPGRSTIVGGGTLISQSQSVNLPNVSPPPIPTTTSNMSNLTSSNTSSNVNITASHSQSALSGLTHAPINISLISPRPGPDRVQNLYVDAPLKPGVISNNQQNVEPSSSRTVEPVSRSNRGGIPTSTSSIITSLSSTNSTSNSSSVTLPKCRKGHLNDQPLDSITSIHRSSTKNTTTSSSCTSHNHHRAHSHHHSHHHHQQKSQALSSKLSNHSVIHQQPSNHLLLQSSPSTLDSTCSTLKKKINSVEEESRISPSSLSSSSDMCKKCCKFQHSGTSGAITNHLLCPNHNSSISSSMSEQQQEHQQSSNMRFNLISTFESPLPRPTSTLPSLPLNSAIRIDQSDSIICRECGRCRCEACRAPRKLPEYWLCGNACVCSSETVVDTISCMCCVKTMFYHCGKDCYFDESTVDDSTNAFDRPCSCTGENACARWSFMGVLGMVLPCLWCYLPLKGCAKGTQSVYQRCTATGCRCSDSSQNMEAHSGNMAPTVPPKMSEKIVGGKSASTCLAPKTSSSGFVSNNSISDNSSSLTSSPTIPSLSSPADSEKRLLE